VANLKASSARYDVSQDLFAILTEAIHLHSDRTSKFQTLRTAVMVVSERLYEYVFDAAHLQTFLDTVPMSGPIRIHLKVQTCINERLTEMKVRLEKISGFPVPDRTAIAYFVQLGIENNVY
jgi:hypothetical protein